MERIDTAASDVAQSDPLIGTVVDGRFAIDSLLGKGGMSSVYKARHLALQQDVAIKILSGSIDKDKAGTERFHREAQAVAGLDHPNIIRVMAFGVTENGTNYIVMQYLAGRSLSAVISDAQIDMKQALEMFAQIASALACAHEKSVLHRDLKPSNVIVLDVPDGTTLLKVIDFGLAKFLPDAGKGMQQLTQTGEVFGSPAYMSPEQCTGQSLDTRSDVYSFGCLMYETITGRPVFEEENAAMTLFKQVHGTPLSMNQVCNRHDIPSEMNQLVLGCLAKGPKERPQSMQELQAQLVSLKDRLADLPRMVPGEKVEKQKPLRARRPRSGMLVACICVLLAATVSLLFIYVSNNMASRIPVAPGKRERALDLLEKADRYCSEHELRSLKILEESGDKTAILLWTRAVEAARNEQNESLLRRSCFGLGSTLRALGRPKDALKPLMEAEQITRDPKDLFKARDFIMTCLVELKDYGAASKYLAKQESVVNPTIYQRSQIALYKGILSTDKDPAYAVQQLKECIKLAHECGLPPLAMSNYEWHLAQALKKLGRIEEANKIEESVRAIQMAEEKNQSKVTDQHQ
jgi:serine/threonine protein kinase